MLEALIVFCWRWLKPVLLSCSQSLFTIVFVKRKCSTGVKNAFVIPAPKKGDLSS